MKPASWLSLLALAGSAAHACGGHDDDDDDGKEWTKEELAELQAKWGHEARSLDKNKTGEKLANAPSSGRSAASGRLPTSTTSSASRARRKSARFGPRAIRQASSRQTSLRAFNPRANVNPYQNWARIIDCGDIPITPLDNAIAAEQMTQAFRRLGRARPASALSAGKPKLVTLGGDHSLALPALRALREIYGRPIRVLHFDAHLDTWDPAAYPSAWGSTHFTHGSMFWMANAEGLLSNASAGPSVHAGLRTRLTGTDWADHEADTAQNWVRFAADDIDEVGTQGIVDGIMAVLGTDDPVYLSVDIDVLDPAFAPGTGTPEPGGWTTRELIRILRGVEGLNLVGADVVEVSPAYQGRGEETALAAAQVVYEILSSMVKRGLEDGVGETGSGGKDEL
ncbi:Ureohydrolase [Metarhizium robertsii ARSEF 23]|uniref:Ureohydrolase n=1 Tax=Metarhizium robertsii (strain ARSEF 23 / ATCC MYA-3075) TaxID=655844 RepID=E9F5L8_METRA|nr:Ureohydrolase [Metarhizium robertsii ARSEF 23]EFY97021.1 Ureohydrolase [Metarhizium robertsii ARSEF 23]